MDFIIPAEMSQPNVNSAILIGKPVEPPRFSHYGGTDEYQTFPLEIMRLSEISDSVNIIARKIDLEDLALAWTGTEKLWLEGEVRSFNNRVDESTSRLIITILAKELRYARAEESDRNDIRIKGVLCKSPILRKTPMGRQICDLMLAVNRRFGRSDYLPCIAWGKVATQIAVRSVGASVNLSGRLQSRKYIKNTDKGPEERMAYEVSIVSLEENYELPVLDDFPSLD